MSKQKFEHFKLSVKILKCLLRIIQRFHIRHQSLSIYYTRSSQDGLALLMLSGKSFRARQRKKKKHAQRCIQKIPKWSKIKDTHVLLRHGIPMSNNSS